jgi:diguanylate cyclase
LIGPLTASVLNLALAQVKLWADAGQGVPVAVNISARNLLDEDFASKVKALLSQHRVAPELLEIEVTESAVMLEPARAAKVLNELRAIGVRIALDDFGAGYTSLAQLRNLPISELKIDKSFILSMDSNTDDTLIVKSMVDLGHGLNMKVVAEGIETQSTMDVLAGFDCDTGQGYHLCRPVPAHALMQWHGQQMEQAAQTATTSANTGVQSIGRVALRAV